MVVTAFGLSPSSLKTTGPAYCMSPPDQFVFLRASTMASGSVDLARSSTSAMSIMPS